MSKELMTRVKNLERIVEKLIQLYNDHEHEVTTGSYSAFHEPISMVESPKEKYLFHHKFKLSRRGE